MIFLPIEVSFDQLDYYWECLAQWVTQFIVWIALDWWFFVWNWWFILWIFLWGDRHKVPWWSNEACVWVCICLWDSVWMIGWWERTVRSWPECLRGRDCGVLWWGFVIAGSREERICRWLVLQQYWGIWPMVFWWWSSCECCQLYRYTFFQFWLFLWWHPVLDLTVAIGTSYFGIVVFGRRRWDAGTAWVFPWCRVLGRWVILMFVSAILLRWEWWVAMAAGHWHLWLFFVDGVAFSHWVFCGILVWRVWVSFWGSRGMRVRIGMFPIGDKWGLVSWLVWVCHRSERVP